MPPTSSTAARPTCVTSSTAAGIRDCRSTCRRPACRRASEWVRKRSIPRRSPAKDCTRRMVVSVSLTCEATRPS